jgi:hypothetical protein
VIAPLSGFDGRTRFPDHAASMMRSAVIPRVRKRWLALGGMFRRLWCNLGLDRHDSHWGMHFVRSPSQNGGNLVTRYFPESRVAAANELIEIAVQDPCSRLKQQVSAAWRPPHRLTFVEALVHDLVDR